MDIKDQKIKEKIGVGALVLILVITGFLLIKNDSKPIEYKEGTQNQSSIVTATTGNTAVENVKNTEAKVTGKININTASIEDLDTLPGIGEKTAQKIIDYRTTKGRFLKPEDIKNVSGIGDAKYEAIKDLIEI